MGSSGSGRRSEGSRGGSADEVNNCDNVNVVVSLSGPNEQVLRRLKLKSPIEVVLVTMNGRSIVEAQAQGERVGTVTVSGLQKLIDCLQAGYKFKGVVEELDGGWCTVRVVSAAAPNE